MISYIFTKQQRNDAMGFFYSKLPELRLNKKSSINLMCSGDLATKIHLDWKKNYLLRYLITYIFVNQDVLSSGAFTRNVQGTIKLGLLDYKGEWAPGVFHLDNLHYVMGHVFGDFVWEPVFHFWQSNSLADPMSVITEDVYEQELDESDQLLEDDGGHLVFAVKTNRAFSPFPGNGPIYMNVTEPNREAWTNVRHWDTKLQHHAGRVIPSFVTRFTGRLITLPDREWPVGLPREMWDHCLSFLDNDLRHVFHSFDFSVDLGVIFWNIRWGNRLMTSGVHARSLQIEVGFDDDDPCDDIREKLCLWRTGLCTGFPRKDEFCLIVDHAEYHCIQPEHFRAFVKIWTKLAKAAKKYGSRYGYVHFPYFGFDSLLDNRCPYTNGSILMDEYIIQPEELIRTNLDKLVFHLAYWGQRVDLEATRENFKLWKK